MQQAIKSDIVRVWVLNDTWCCPTRALHCSLSTNPEPLLRSKSKWIMGYRDRCSVVNVEPGEGGSKFPRANSWAGVSSGFSVLWDKGHLAFPSLPSPRGCCFYRVIKALRLNILLMELWIEWNRKPQRLKIQFAARKRSRLLGARGVLLQPLQVTDCLCGTGLCAWGFISVLP